MPCNAFTLLRIIVSGIKKGPVQRSEKEDELRWFFHSAGCKVAGVSLVMEAKRRDRSRGLSFVDFEDSQSLDLALKLHNEEAEALAGKHGKLRIARACVAKNEGRKRQHEFLEARNQTEEMEREFEARPNELVRKVKQKCERQNVAQARGLLLLQQEKRRQVVLQRGVETIKDVAHRIHTAMEVEGKHAMATVNSVHGEQTQRHKDELPVCTDYFANFGSFPSDDRDPATIASNLLQQ